MKKLLILNQDVNALGCMEFSVEDATFAPFKEDIDIYVSKFSSRLDISEFKARNYFLNALYGDLNSNECPSFQKIDKETLSRTLIFEGSYLYNVIKSCYKDLKKEISEGFNDLGFDPYEELYKNEFIEKYGEEELPQFQLYINDREKFDQRISFIETYGKDELEHFELYLNDREKFDVLMNSDKFPKEGVVFLDSTDKIPNTNWYIGEERDSELFDFEFIGEIVNNSDHSLYLINIEKVDEDDLKEFIEKHSEMKYYSVNCETNLDIDVISLNVV